MGRPELRGARGGLPPPGPALGLKPPPLWPGWWASRWRYLPPLLLAALLPGSPWGRWRSRSRNFFFQRLVPPGVFFCPPCSLCCWGWFEVCAWALAAWLEGAEPDWSPGCWLACASWASPPLPLRLRRRRRLLLDWPIPWGTLDPSAEPELADLPN